MQKYKDRIDRKQGGFAIHKYLSGEEYFKDSDVFLNKWVFSKPTSFHAHNFIEIAYVASGSGIHNIDHRQYDCQTGDVCIINYDRNDTVSLPARPILTQDYSSI